MRAFILAGGKGTRLGSISEHTPKCLVKIEGKHFIEYQLEFLKTQGISHVVFCLGHLANEVKKTINDGKKYGMLVTYIVESVPKGTGGALIDAKEYFEDVSLIVNGDTFVQFDVQEMVREHLKNKADLTIGMIESDSVDESYDHLLVDTDSKIVGFKKNTVRKKVFVNSGVYVSSQKLFFRERASVNRIISLEKELIPSWISSGEAIYGHVLSCRYFYDIGTPERIGRFESHLKKGGKIC